MMQLNEILSKYPEFSLAKAEENKEILDFYHSHQMQTSGLQIFTDRGEDFFEHLKAQGGEIFVFIYRNEKNQLKGVGTISVRIQIVNGLPSKVLYQGDLRVESSREVSKRWKQLYSEILTNMNQIQEFDSPYNFAVIMHSNLRAIRSLVKNQNNFDYVLLDDFEMVNVFCKIPGTLIKSCYDVSVLREKEELEEFMNTHGKKYQLGLDYELFCDRFESYQGLVNSDVLVVRDGKRIIGSTILWHPSPQKRIVLKSLPWFLKLFNRVLSLVTFAPKVGEEFKMNYLNDLVLHTDYDKSEVVQSIFHYLYKNKAFEKYHAIAFASFKKDPIQLKGFLQDKTKLLLYTVKSGEPNEILEFDKNFNFNLSWV